MIKKSYEVLNDPFLNKGTAFTKEERKELKDKIDKLMKSYSDEKIDGDTYFKRMMKLSASYKKKK